MESDIESTQELGGLSGMSNGEIQENIERITKEYLDCNEIEKSTSVLNAYDFALEAAELGEPRAQAALAENFVSPQYEAMSDEERKQYRQEMGDFLKKSAEQCEPNVFRAIARHGRPHYAMYWDFKEKAPSEIEKLASLITYAMIYSLQYSDGSGSPIVEAAQQELNTMPGATNKAIMSQAIEMARATYSTYCGSPVSHNL